MREPQTWYDKSLLKDEPFLSAFKARQLAAPPTRRSAGHAGEDDDARNDAIVKEILDMNLSEPVQAWLDLAFKPHYRQDIYRRVTYKDPGMICLFVQFYWTLSHDHKSATRILQAERKRQGYGGFLEELSRRGDTLVSTADLMKQVVPKQRSQIGDDAFQSPSKKVPRDIKSQKNSNAKKDVPGYPEQEGKSSSHTCPPSLDPTSLSIARQIESNPSILPLPPDSQDTTTICDLPKKRKGRQINPDRRRIKHRKINEASSDTSKSCNVSQNRNDLIDEKTKARPSQREDFGDKADHVSNGALCGQSLFKKVPGKPCILKSNKNLNIKNVPGRPEREGKNSSQTCPPFLDPTSLSVTREIESNPSTLPPPPDSQNTSDLPKPRKRQTSPDTPRKKHRKFNETTSDTSKLCNVSQNRNDVIDEKTQARPSQCEDISDKTDVSNSALSGQPPFKKVPGSIPRFLKFNKILNTKDVPGRPEREGESSSQTCPPSLDPTSLSVTRKIGSNPSALPLPPNSQNTSDLPEPRKRQTSPDTQRKKHQGINEATSDANKLGDNNNLLPQSQTWSRFEWEEDALSLSCPPIASFTSESTRIELDETVLSLPSSAPVPKIHDPQGGVEAHPAQGKQKSRSNFKATKKTSVLASRPKDATHQPKQYGTTSDPKKRRASSSEGHQWKRQDAPVDQDSVPIIVQADLGKKKRGRAPRVKEGQEGSASTIVQLAPRKKKVQPLISQAQLNAGTVIPFSGQNVDMTQETSITSCIPFSPAQCERQEVPVQQDFVPLFVQPDLAKKKRGRRPKAKEGQEGSASITMQPVSGRKIDRPLKSQPQLNAGTVPFSGQNIDITQVTPITFCIPFSLAQSSNAVSGLQETVEGLSRHDHLSWSMLDRGMKEEKINRPENWLWTQPEEHGLVEDFTLDCEAPAATQTEDRPTDIFPAQKPPLCVNPPIWAQSRQEVCETFDWFRSYQGGVYFVHNAVKGYLLSAFSSKRDRFEHDGKLIISHGGGKSESLHTRKGQTTTQPATDQLAHDKSVRALLNNYRNQRPLALLIDDKYALFPYDLGVKDMTYVVLGFYTIAHAWAEYQPTTNGTGHVVRYKFAFRWCDDQGSPWWLTDKETNLSDLPPPSIPPSFSFEPTSKRKPRKLLNRGEKQSENGEDAVLQHTAMVQEAVSHEPKSSLCRLCHMDSPYVYTWAWLCLHPDCSGFWRDIKGNSPPDNLEYDLSFLKLMASIPVPPNFGKLKPDPPRRLSTDGTVTSYAFTRGFHCTSCGRLSCRFKWEKWECSNCKECLPVSRPAHKAKDFWSNLLPIGYKDHFISKKSKIEQQPVRSFRHENGMGSIQSFVLPDGRGTIHHIQPGTPLGRLEADDIFIEYQQQATAGELKFRRWPLRSHKCRGALLTNYFSQNCGEPYQYVGGTANTVPFENAPGAVVKARALIQKRVQQALGKHVEFNEILSAAYMERQKMAFHSDNEIGLGPVVAGLSLGSPALMHFRINAKYDRLRELKGNLLSFVLRHGDILVMDGASVQEYYEHTVIPNNFRIAATARHITPEHA